MLRDRIVGSTRRGSAVVSRKYVCGGGSSSSLSRALAASGLDSWGTSRSASPITNTLGPPSTDFMLARRSISRALATPWIAIPSGTVQSGCSRRSAITSPRRSPASSTCLSGSPAFGRGIGTNQCTSGCASPRTRRHGPQDPQGRAAAPASGPPSRSPALAGPSHTNACATQSAKRCLPTPWGPARSTVCGKRFASIASRTRAVASV